MKEHDFLTMSDFDDEITEEISERVNALSESDKDKIYADCMAKMRIDISEDTGRKIKVSHSGFRRFMPVVSAAACVLIAAGALIAITANRMSFDKNEAFYNTADSAQSEEKDVASNKGDSETAYDISDSIENEDFAAGEAVGSAQHDHKGEYEELFADLFEDFDFAFALISDCPLYLDEANYYIKSADGAEYQYYKVMDDRISSCSEVEETVKKVFSKAYYTEYCSNLTEDESPLYEENEEGLYTRAASSDLKYEWSDSDPEIIRLSEEEFMVRKTAVLPDNNQIYFQFSIVAENGVWKIDTFDII